MQNLYEQEMTVTKVVCPKCSRHLGRIIDGVYMCIGEGRFYESVRFTCSCGKPMKFRVREFEMTALEDDAKKILHGLGNKRRRGKKPIKIQE